MANVLDENICTNMYTGAGSIYLRMKSSYSDVDVLIFKLSNHN